MHGFEIHKVIYFLTDLELKIIRFKIIHNPSKNTKQLDVKNQLYAVMSVRVLGLNFADG